MTTTEDKFVEAVAPRLRRTAFLTAIAAVAAAGITAASVNAYGSVATTGRQHRLAGQAGAGRGPTAYVATALPRYMVTIPAMGVGNLDVQNAVTGKLAAEVRTPGDYLHGGYWYSLAAQGPRTFVAGKVDGNVSFFYRFVLTRDGRVASIHHVGRKIRGVVMGASITPDGRYIGYILMTVLPHGRASTALYIRNLVTGKVTASWPIPENDTISSLSLDASGTAMAISAYTYKPSSIYMKIHKHADLIQWTSVLVPGTSGTPIDRLPTVDRQASSVALSADGGTLYEFLQKGRVTGASWRDRSPVNFELVAIDVATGKIASVLHTSRAVWSDFIPELALGPAGRYLLVVNNATMARLDIPARRYTALPGTISPLEINGKDTQGQGGNVDPLAW
jgi:hypothetical protein